MSLIDVMILISQGNQLWYIGYLAQCPHRTRKESRV